MEKEYRAQSRHWASYRIVSPDEIVVGGKVVGVRLLQKAGGNLTEIEIQPGGQWSGLEISFSGKVSVSKKSTAETLDCLACTGNWSGGGNYRGWLFGKPGAAFWLVDGSSQKWVVFTAEGLPQWHDVNPWKKAKEL